MLKSFIKYNRQVSEALTKRFPTFFGVPASYHTELMGRIGRDIKKQDNPKILEVGGIDRPLLEKNSQYTYVGLDIESKDQCYEIYDKFLVQSIEGELEGTYDLIISITLLEHVPDNKASMQTMFMALKPGKAMHHYVPSKWHPYSVALRIVGPKIQKKMIPMLRPDAKDVTGYPAFFNHCSVGQMKRLCKKAGFEDIDIIPYYRANDYFSFFTPLYILDTAFENMCRVLNLSFFCSGFVVSATHPKDSS